MGCGGLVDAFSRQDGVIDTSRDPLAAEPCGIAESLMKGYHAAH